MPTQKPAPQASTSSSSQKKTRVSTSELRVLVYLYGLEMRNCKEKESDLPSPCLDMPRSSKKKPLGPRSSSRPAASSLPEDKFHFESALAAASSRHPQSGFADFPLVLIPQRNTQPQGLPSTLHSPFQSPNLPDSLLPSSVLHPLSTHSPPISLLPSPRRRKQRPRSTQSCMFKMPSWLSVSKSFFRTQGVCEDDLRVNFDEQGMVARTKRKRLSWMNPRRRVWTKQMKRTIYWTREFLIEEEEHGTWVIRLRYRHRHLPLFRSPQ